METVLEVRGMTCEECKERVSQALCSVPGVTHVAVDWRGGSAHVVHEAVSAPEQFVRAIEEASWRTSHQFKASVEGNNRNETPDNSSVPFPDTRKGGCC